jgi:hypothetical protein
MARKAMSSGTILTIVLTGFMLIARAAAAQEMSLVVVYKSLVWFPFCLDA